MRPPSAAELPVPGHDGRPRRWPIFLAFLRIGFLRMLAYRVRYVVGISNYLIYVAVAHFLWEAVYRSRAAAGTAAAENIDGYLLVDIDTYIAVGWIIRAAYFNNVDHILAGRFVQGDISTDMTRPCSLYLMFYGDAVGEGLFRLVMMSLPCAFVLASLFDIHGPAGALHGLLFIVSALLAFQLFFCINFLTGLLALYFENLEGFLWAKFNIIQLLSGVLFPLEFLPGLARTIFDWLPFKHIGHTPLVIYLGKVDGADMWRLLGVQALWCVILYVLCQIAWRRARRVLSIQGG